MSISTVNQKKRCKAVYERKPEGRLTIVIHLGSFIWVTRCALKMDWMELWHALNTFWLYNCTMPISACTWVTGNAVFKVGEKIAQWHVHSNNRTCIPVEPFCQGIASMGTLPPTIVSIWLHFLGCQGLEDWLPKASPSQRQFLSVCHRSTAHNAETTMHHQTCQPRSILSLQATVKCSNNISASTRAST